MASKLGIPVDIAALRITGPSHSRQLKNAVPDMDNKTGAETVSLTTRLWLLAVSLVVFVVIAWQVMTGGPLVRFDLWAQQSLQGARETVLVALASWFTLLGNYSLVIVVTLLGCLLLGFRGAWPRVAGLLVSVVGGGLSIFVIKAFFDRPRPEPLDGIVTASSSFPSGNSILAAALFGAVALVVLPEVLRNQALRFAVALCLLAPLLVAASRVILSVHYVSDTLAGLAVGGAWALTGSLLIPRT